jgi:hypothetical protein
MSGEFNSPKWIVGIDLGTTHCALSVKRPGGNEVELLSVPQFVDVGQVQSNALLPSFGLQPDALQMEQLRDGLPWGYQGGLLVGEMARSQAYKQPGRVITSAKSWLSHEGVDRTENILPWGADEGVTTCSPVIAASAYLTHLRNAFEHNYPEAGSLKDQEVILTVPASFDPVARSLTLRAAEIAGIGQPRLLEEPQAALYAWLNAKGDAWRDELTTGDVVLVCDVGGGTTDFSLIAIDEEQGTLALNRIAVGDHILLGGDNMDLTLAFVVRQQLQKAQGVRLDRWQFQALTQACRVAKESLFNDSALGACAVVVPSRGSKLIGGSIRTELTRAVLNQVLMEGFLPRCDWDEPLKASARSALSNVGLPYAEDAGITRHMASFLRRHARDGKAFLTPTAVLFNGGVFKATELQERICDTMDAWAQANAATGVRTLGAINLDASVALGAACFGGVTQGEGIRIRGGVAHAYYVGIEEAMPAIPGFDPPVNAVCLVPAGTEEGSVLMLDGHVFSLRLGQQSEFRLFSSSVRKDDAIGTSFEVWSASDLVELPRVQATLPSEDGVGDTQVRLECHVTEVGTIELFCVSAGVEAQRWGLVFNIRSNENVAG